MWRQPGRGCWPAGPGYARSDADWAAGLPVQIAALLAEEPAVERVRARRLDRAQQVALVAAQEAWRDAGHPEVDLERLAVVVGTGVGGVQTLLAQYDVLNAEGPRKVSPHSVPMFMANGPAATVGLELGAQGGVHTPVSACATGAEAVSLGLDIIRSGRADVVVAGGCESGASHPLAISGFASMRALSTRADVPEAASRPFDKGRDGFVIGEGAAMLVLESQAHAAARGAPRHAVLAGSAITSDAFHVAAPDPSGGGAARSIRLALRDADLSPGDVRHVNAHATSTPIGDLAEARALRAALGAAADGAAVSATKSMTGHMLGAAGAFEAVATVLALRDKVIPAIRNLEDPDDEVELDLVRFEPRSFPSGAALSTSFGFGGHNVCLAFTRDGQ